MAKPSAVRDPAGSVVGADGVGGHVPVLGVADFVFEARDRDRLKCCVGTVGTISPQYVLVAADAGRRIRVRVTANNPFGSAARFSNATAAIAN